MIPALFSGIRRQIVGTAQRKVRRKRQRGSRGRECVCVREIACARLSHCPVFPKPARFFRISLYWTTFHHYVRAWDRLRDRQRERERRGKKPTSLPLPFFHFFPLRSSILRHPWLSKQVEQAKARRNTAIQKKKLCFAARQTQRSGEITFSTIKTFKALVACVAGV